MYINIYIHIYACIIIYKYMYIGEDGVEIPPTAQKKGRKPAAKKGGKTPVRKVCIHNFLYLQCFVIRLFYCIYICICVYIFIYIYVYIYICINIYIHIYIYMYINVYIYIYICI
jgi:hypothetical protein